MIAMVRAGSELHYGGRAPRELWTPEDDERLVELRAAGASWSEISTALDRTVRGAKERAKRLARR